MKIILLLAAILAFTIAQDCYNPKNGEFEYTALDFPYDALQPSISEQIMTLHHDKHYRGYTSKCNAAIKGTDMEGLNIDHVLRYFSSTNTAVRNNCGGWHNHCLFWKFLQGNGHQTPQGPLAEAITKAFGSYENFQSAFDKQAAGVFGSGWAWLVLKTTTVGGHYLEVCNTPNQDSPIFNENKKTTFAPCEGKIILALDVWEHAYYLDYFNVRGDYINSWWQVANWRYAEQRFSDALAHKPETKQEL